MKIKIPKDLNTLSKEQLIELIHELIAKMDNLEVETARAEDTAKEKSSCKPKTCCRGKCK